MKSGLSSETGGMLKCGVKDADADTRECKVGGVWESKRNVFEDKLVETVVAIE